METMNDKLQGELSRRSLIKGGVSALAGMAIASLTVTKTSAAEAKLAKSAVQYEDVGKQKGADCDDCVQFIPGKTANALGTCKIVEGEISPHGHCIAFAPKPGK
jgi:secreted PhoX family phosphatase